MRAIVTGGAGFLGSHLVEQLLNEGAEVICVDNFQTGSEARLAPFYENKRFSVINADIGRSIPDLACDIIYNLACPASPPHYQADPIGTMRTNVVGMMNVLELAKRHSAIVFQASTSEIYGNPLEHPQSESYLGNVSTTGPRACYDEGKRAAETLCFDYERIHGIDIRIVRIFNTYGPRMDADDGRVVSNFVIQALKNAPITIYGDGTQTRSFCYCDDLIRGFLALTASPKKTSGPVNLGNPNEFTVLQLAQLVLEMTGSSSEIVHLPMPEDDPVMRQPDISRAKELLNWEPKVPLAEGLAKTIDYFKSITD